MITEIKRNLRLRSSTFCLSLGQTTGDKLEICGGDRYHRRYNDYPLFSTTSRFAVEHGITTTYNRPSMIDRLHISEDAGRSREPRERRELTSPLGMRLN